jgi:hypothetical protein
MTKVTPFRESIPEVAAVVLTVIEKAFPSEPVTAAVGGIR